MLEIKSIMRKCTAFSLMCGLLVTNYVYATNLAINDSNPNDPVIYQLNDSSSANATKIITYQSDIKREHWNTDVLGDVSPEIYRDFPMQIDKNVNDFAELGLSFTYLKLLDDGNTASFVISDRDTDEIMYSDSITAENINIKIDALSMGRTFNLKLIEVFNDVTSTYCAVIETKRKAADFPSNVSLASYSAINENFVSESVFIAEVDKSTETSFTDAEGNKTIIAADRQPVEVKVADLPEYYNSLEKDKLYNIQASLLIEGFYNDFYGFISTFDGDEYLGAFIPSYSFYTEADYEAKLTKSLQKTNVAITTMSTGINQNYIKNNYVEYTYMQDERFSLPRYNKQDLLDDFIIIGFKFPETGSYTIGTLGNTATSAEYWSEYNGNIGFQRIIQGNGSNFSQTISVIGGEIRYYVVYFEDYSSGTSIFRIKYNEYPNDVSNSVYELENTASKAPYNTVIQEKIHYPQDVDVFYVNNYINGEYGFSMKNLSSSKALMMKVYVRYPNDSSLWTVTTKTINAGKSLTYVPNLTNINYHYFIYVYAADRATAWESYELQIITPDKGDPYENNDTFAIATQLPNLTGAINDLTLHKGDIDYFKFTTGVGGATAWFWLNEVFDRVYNMNLYEQSTSGQTLVASGTKANGENYLEINNLKGSTTYYICINNTGMGSDAYTAVGETTLEWGITNKPAPMVPTAVLSNNVVYSILDSDELLDLNTLLDNLMAKLTCFENSTEIPDSTARANVKLYYMNENVKTELSAAVINNLAIGSYVVIAEYKGATATGGTITLSILAETVDMVEINVSAVREYMAEYDWLQSAKTMANVRLAREGSVLSTKTSDDVAELLGIDLDNPARGTLVQTLRATCLFYTNGASTSTPGFIRSTTESSVAEDELYDMIANGSVAIMQLADSTATTDTTKMRYVVICGVNKTTHQYKVYDSLQTSANLIRWIDQSALSQGGYVPANSNVKFLGSIIEVSI